VRPEPRPRRAPSLRRSVPGGSVKAWAGGSARAPRRPLRRPPGRRLRPPWLPSRASPRRLSPDPLRADKLAPRQSLRTPGSAVSTRPAPRSLCHSGRLAAAYDTRSRGTCRWARRGRQARRCRPAPYGTLGDTRSPVPMARAEVARSQMSVVITAPFAVVHEGFQKVLSS
jgi:hypothetical protein